MRLTVGVFVVCGALLAGCGTDPEVAKSPQYRLGYGDGCSTANSRVRGGHNKVYRNDELYKKDKIYQTGWRDGYVACGDRANPDGFGIDPR